MNIDVRNKTSYHQPRPHFLQGMNWMFEVVHKILVRKENSSPIAPEMWPPDKEQPNYIQLRDSPSPRLMFTHLQPKMAPPGLAAPVNKV